MVHRFLYAACLVALPSFLFAQVQMKLPAVTGNELQQESYPADPDADAAILVDLGTSMTNPGRVVIQHHRIRRIKIYTNEGLGWADWTLGLYKSENRSDNLVSFKAYVYNFEKGKVVKKKISKKDLIKVKVNDDYSEVKLAFPNVKPGSIIEVDYKVESDYLYRFTWNFQHNIPVVRSEFSAGLHNYYKFNFLLRNHLPFFQEGANHWRFMNVPAFKNEPFLTSKADVLASVSYNMVSAQFPGQSEPIFSIGTWNQAKEIIANSWKRYDFGQAKIKDYVDSKLANVSLDSDGLQRAFQIMRRDFVWDGYHSIYQSVRFEEMLEGQKGASADLNRLAHEVLRLKGFKPAYYIASTLGHGKAKYQIPIIDKFNHLLNRVVVGGMTYWLDLTSDQGSMVLPPTKLLGVEALDMKKSNQPIWRTIKTSRAAVERAAATISFDLEDGFTKIDYSLVIADYAKPKFQDQDKNVLLSQMGLTLGEEYVLDSMTVKTSDQEAEPMTISCTYRNPTELLGKLIVINPLLTNKMITSPFNKDETRYNPIHFPYKVNKSYRAQILVPDGFEVEGLPEAVNLSLGNGLGEFFYRVIQSGDKIDVLLRFKVNEIDIDPSLFPAFIQFYDRVQASMAESIVFKSKG